MRVYIYIYVLCLELVFASSNFHAKREQGVVVISSVSRCAYMRLLSFCVCFHRAQIPIRSRWKGRVELQVVLHSLTRRSGLPHLLKLQAVLHRLHPRGVSQVLTHQAERPAVLHGLRFFWNKLSSLATTPNAARNQRLTKSAPKIL